jgi:hypothetical protein
MRVAVYETATGTIRRIVVCPDAAAAYQQSRAGEAVVPVGPEVSDATHRIENGEPLSLT